ncbi:DUF4127 family protein [bacterium]|nr:DUF4127 family protein [bacterium]
MKKIAIVPIDNRPICYNLISDICAQDENIKLYLPPREDLGGLIKPARIENIFSWLENLPDVDFIILSLDTLAYGGLVNSRRCTEDFDEILLRVKRLEKIIDNQNAKIYAFSSIMRISNNSINEEEKEYWNPWGKKIFEYSYHLHKSRRLYQANCVINTIPKEILEDYIKTRERNFKINNYYLELAKKNIINTLIFSKDDCAEFGLNVEEAEKLAKASEGHGNILIKTGADEIPLTLLARAIIEEKKLTVQTVFAHNNSKNKISKYEDITLADCTKGQLSLAGVEIKDDADLIFYINNFEYEQGDHVLGKENKSNLKHNLDFKKPYFIADVNNANGADKNFMENILDARFDNNFLGYSGYNTSANTIGSVICMALVKYFADKPNEKAFKKLNAIRFLDDWAYQANIRKIVRQEGETLGKFEIAPHEKEFEFFEDRIKKYFNYNYKKARYSLPWSRSFEVEIKIDD